MTAAFRAHAKINWALDITGRRADGYHLLNMVMQSIDLHDDLLIAPADALTLTVDGEPVSLTPLEYDVLRLLMQNAGTVFSPQEIYRRVWHEEPAGDNPVAVHIRHIREKIEINPAEPRYLKVVWGKGYKMEGESR